MKIFAKIVTGLKLLNRFSKNSIFDVWQSAKFLPDFITV